MIYFCHVIVKFTASLESPYFWVTYSFEGATPGILLVTPYDLPRGGTVSRGNMNLGNGCLGVGAQGQCGRYFAQSWVSIIDPVFTCCFSFVIPFG